MELRHLRYFTVVADELHFGRAAERLNMSQPPLSQQIRNLENEIGAQLLVRTSRRVSLTRAGEVFRRRAHAILEAADNATAEANRIAEGREATITSGYMSTAMLDQFVPILHHFRLAFPDVDVHLKELSPTSQLEGLLAGQLDLAFVDIPPKNGRLMAGDQTVAAQTAWREELVAAVPIGHRLANRSRISLSELAEDDFVVPPRQPATGLYDRIIALCQNSGFSPRLARRADVLPVVMSLVAAGYGVSVVPACVCQPWLGLAKFPALEDRATVGVTMAWRSEDATSATNALRTMVQEMSPDLITAAFDRATHLHN